MKGQNDWATAVAVVWFILGVAAPAPALPMILCPQLGTGGIIVLGAVATAMWLLPPYFLIFKN